MSVTPTDLSRFNFFEDNEDALRYTSSQMLIRRSIHQFVPVLGILGWSLVSQAQAAPAKIALIQFNADANFNQGAYLRGQLTELAFKAVSLGAKIIVFPEGSSYGYAFKNPQDPEQVWMKWCRSSQADPKCVDVAQVAERVPGGQSSVYWSDFSRRFGVYILFTVPEIDGDHFYVALGVADPTGHVRKYRKRQLWVLDEAYASSGGGNFILKTEFGSFGLLVCKDVTFPGLLEDYAIAGLKAVILPMNWDRNRPGADNPFAAENFLRARASKAGLDIYAADIPTWDGTAMYPASGEPRGRGTWVPFARQVPMSPAVTGEGIALLNLP